MNYKKKSIIFLLVLICSIFSLYANYRILDYKIKVDVSEDNVLSVREDYVFEFDTPRHGFYRVIPYRNYPFHNIKISDLEVEGGPYKTSKSNGLYTIQVGDEDKTVTGEVPYSISYNFDIGADTYEDYDEFYFNLVGTMWECPIEKASFEVVFPKPINEEMIWLTVGSLNSENVDNSLFSLESDNKTLVGSVTSLSAKEGVTLRSEMEDGYFVGARNYQTAIKIVTILLIILNIALVVFAYLIFNKYGRDDKVIERSRFTPPDGFTPLSLFYFIHNAFTSTSYSASFIYWADKGYIDIKENEDESVRLIRKVDFSQVNKDVNNDLDYNLFTAIFKNAEIGEEVDLTKLDSEAFGTALNKLNKAAEKKFPSKVMTDRKSSKMKAYIFLFALISGLLFFLFSYVATSQFMPLTLVGFFFYLVLSVILLSSVNSKWSIYKPLKKIGLVFGLLVLTFIFFVVNYLNISFLNLVDSTTNLIVSAVSTISMFFLVVLFTLTEKRSQFVQKTLEDLLGYTSFLKLVEIDQIEKMIEEDPSFYFKNLCYAQILGLTKTWEKKFAKIKVTQPSWYISSAYGMYAYSRINNVTNSLNSSLNIPIAEYTKAHASKSSSSGFSGSVGGGAGGGGGGAW